MHNKEALDIFFQESGEHEQPKIIDKKNVNTKDWSSEWLRIREANILEAGENKIQKPFSQSYVVYRAIRSIAENIPQAIFKIYEGEPGNSTEVPLNHPLQQLFNKPNKSMSRYELWESIATYLNLYGEVFIYLNQSVGQMLGTTTMPAELYSLNPMLMNHTIVDGELVGWIYNRKMPINPNEVIHVKLFNPYNTIRGMSPIQAIRSEMEADYSSARYNKVFFDNGANPDGVVEVDKDKEISIDELRKLKRLWNENHQGTGNSHKTAFLLGGMAYKQMGISQKDMEFLQGREFSRTAILSVFGVPKFVAGFGDKGEVNRSTAVAAKSMFWTTTIQPQLRRIEEKFFADFFMIYAPEYYGKFDLSGIQELKPDMAEALGAGKLLFDLGYTRNEINKRLALGMPTDPDGDIRYLPMNYISNGDSSDAIPAEEEPTKNVDNLVDEVEQVSKEIIYEMKKVRAQHHLKVQGKFERALHKKIKRYIFEVRSKTLDIVNNTQPGNITKEVDVMLQENESNLVKLVTPVYRQIMTQGAQTALANLATERSIYNIEHKQREPLIDEAVLLARVNKIKGINITLFNQLKMAIDEAIEANQTVPEIANILTEVSKGVFNNASNRSMAIARTESNSLLNGSAISTYQREGVRQKEWLTTLDDKARESHIRINGEIIPMESRFSNGLEYPGDPAGPAEEVVNCRCAISPVVI